MLDLNSNPPIDWDEFGEWEGPAHELQYDMVWSGEGNLFSNLFSAAAKMPIYCSCTNQQDADKHSVARAVHEGGIADHGVGRVSSGVHEGGLADGSKEVLVVVMKLHPTKVSSDHLPLVSFSRNLFQFITESSVQKLCDTAILLLPDHVQYHGQFMIFVLLPVCVQFLYGLGLFSFAISATD